MVVGRGKQMAGVRVRRTHAGKRNAGRGSVRRGRRTPPVEQGGGAAELPEAKHACIPAQGEERQRGRPLWVLWPWLR